MRVVKILINTGDTGKIGSFREYVMCYVSSKEELYKAGIANLQFALYTNEPTLIKRAMKQALSGSLAWYEKHIKEESIRMKKLEQNRLEATRLMQGMFQ